MLVPLSCIRRAISWSRRHYSDVSSVSKYHPKVRAIPFAFSKDAAITHVGTNASAAMLVNSDNNQYSPVFDLFSSIMAKYLPSTGFKALQPDRIQALYYPTWFVDAEVEAKAWLSADSEDAQNAVVFINDSYLPGFGMDLGRLTLFDRSMGIEAAVPFSDDLVHQHGSDVICLPYNITPMDLLGRVRNISFQQATVDENTRFDPRSLKCNLLAAYPVLIPVYLAQYVPIKPYSPLTIIIEAHGKPGRHYLHATASSSGSVHLPIENFTEEDYVKYGSESDASPIDARIIFPRSSSDTSDALRSWLCERIEERETPTSLVSEQAVDMDDLRVREWTNEEVEPVRKWFKLGESIFHLKDMLKFISSVNPDRVKVIEFPPRFGSKTDSHGLLSGLEGFFKAEADKLQKLEETRAAETPEWWKRWSTSQTPKE